MNDGKICVSVCAETANEMLEQIRRAENLADVIEIRFDCFEESEFELSLRKISSLNCKKPFLATFRPKEKTSEFTIGKTVSQVDLTNNVNVRKQRIINWIKILQIKNICFVDIDEDLLFGMLMREFYDAQISSVLNDFRQELAKYRVIVSLHDFNEVPHKIEDTYAELSDASKNGLLGELVKIAVQANEITDTIPIWKLLKKAKLENKQIIPIAMGESGKWTRILGLAHGAFMTYASLDAGQETAPGQVSITDLIKVYRVKELDEQTEIYGIIGGNTSYSMSPYMHNAAFKFAKLNAVFVPLQVGNLDEFMTRMVKLETREIELNFKGFAVTIPHKQNIIKHLDFVDDTAQKIGAVNTVKIIDGKLYGYNTDASGFIEPLKITYGDLENVKVAMFGAGGAARACVYALTQENADVTVFARDVEKAKTLADEFEVNSSKFKNSDENYGEFDILINATPLGTKGKSEDQTVAVAEQIKDVNLVYDLIYNPFQTRLMAEADKVHVPKVGGLAMLVAQGMKQFEIWTGKPAPMKEMSAAALRRLG